MTVAPAMVSWPRLVACSCVSVVVSWCCATSSACIEREQSVRCACHKEGAHSDSTASASTEMRITATHRRTRRRAASGRSRSASVSQDQYVSVIGVIGIGVLGGSGVLTSSLRTVWSPMERARR